MGNAPPPTHSHRTGLSSTRNSCHSRTTFSFGRRSGFTFNGHEVQRKNGGERFLLDQELDRKRGGRELWKKGDDGT